MAKFYKYTNGVRTPISNREVKAFIMKQNNWTSEEYNKQYDIFKNKLRAFEAYERAGGKQVVKQSPQELLYKQAQAMKREGSSYKPSIKMQRIESFSAVASNRAEKLLQNKLYASRRAATYEEATSKQFSGLIKANAGARHIAETIKDPVAREAALARYANDLHAKIDAQDRAAEAEAIPSGEEGGSPDTIPFDISSYIT